LLDSSAAGAVAFALASAGSEAGLDSTGAASSSVDLVGAMGASPCWAVGSCATFCAGALVVSSDMVPSGDGEVMGM
jgi:hypothetical protein